MNSSIKVSRRVLVALSLLSLGRFDHALAADAGVNNGAGLPSQPVTFGYTLHTAPDALDAQVSSVEKFVRAGLRKLVRNVTNVGRASNLTSSYDGDEKGE
jgi:hypothetical protein